MTKQDLKAISGHPNYYVCPDNGFITFRKSVNGDPVKISTGVTGIKEAKSIVHEKFLELFSENSADDKRKRKGIINPLLKDVNSELMEIRIPSASKSTQNKYRIAWNILDKFWGSKTCNEVTQKTMIQFEKWYLENHSKRSYFDIYKHLRMLFRYSFQQKYIQSIPKMIDLDETINFNVKRKKVGRVYTDAEIKSLIESASQRCRIGILFGRYMGMRKMEFLSLEWERIDFEKSIAQVWSFKNKKWREIPIPSFLLKELKDWKEKNHNNKFIFQMKSRPNHISSQLFDQDWNRAKNKSKIKRNGKLEARIHDLRHTFATRTAQDNWPPIVACQVLDMSLEIYQKTYVHISNYDIMKMMNKSFGVNNG